MTNPLSVCGQYAMGGMDPYLYYALMSPNINSPAFRGAVPASDATAVQTPAAQTTAAQAAATTQPTFEAAPEPEEKKSGVAKFLLGIATVGAAAFCLKKAYARGSADLTLGKRLLDGGKILFEGLKEKLGGLKDRFIPKT